jgi:hypothetical protein
MTDTLTLPKWPSASSIFFIHAAQTYNAWMALGVSRAFAIGLGVTQAEFESWFTWSANGDNHEAFNFYQWHWQPRGLSILAATQIDVRKEQSIRRIVDAAWWELNHTHIKARDAVNAAASINESAFVACKLYEGAGAKNAPQRRALGGDRWDSWFTENAAFVAANPAL